MPETTAIEAVERRLTPREKLALAMELAVEDLNERETQALLVGGDLAVLRPAAQTAYVAYQAKRIGLDPMSQPFLLLAVDGRVILYAKKECAEMLRAKHHVAVEVLRDELTPDTYTVFVRASVPDKDFPSGVRFEDNCASSPILTAKGKALADLKMKTFTKALRRATLAITGCGFSGEDDRPEGAQPIGIE